MSTKSLKSIALTVSAAVALSACSTLAERSFGLSEAEWSNPSDLSTISNSPDAARAALIAAGATPLTVDEAASYMARMEGSLREGLDGENVEISMIGESVLLVTTEVHAFDTGSSMIPPALYTAVDEIGSALSQYGRTFVDVTGHTDSQGLRRRNQALSEERALGVASYLISRGVAAPRVIVGGAGESQPIIETGDGVAEPRNRRIEFTILPLL